MNDKEAIDRIIKILNDKNVILANQKIFRIEEVIMLTRGNVIEPVITK